MKQETGFVKKNDPLYGTLDGKWLGLGGCL